MATHRKPPVSVMPPPELFVYSPADWDSLEAWCEARRDWVKAHGRDTALGNMLDVLRGDRATRKELYGWKY
jgi:hypothetical protein